MSCGNPHEVDCTEVLDQVYVFIDGEAGEETCIRIRQHLAECGPCLQKFGLEQAVKALVARSCGCEPVPEDLRQRVLVRIHEVQITLSADEPDPVSD